MNTTKLAQQLRPGDRIAYLSGQAIGLNCIRQNEPMEDTIAHVTFEDGRYHVVLRSGYYLTYYRGESVKLAENGHRDDFRLKGREQSRTVRGVSIE